MANVYGLIFEVEDKTGRGTRSISGNLKKIQTNADKAKAALRGVGSIAGSAVGALGKVAAGATAAAAAFGFLAKKNLEALDAIGKTASKLGVSTNFLTEYSLVANQAGLSTDQFQTGLQRFIRRLGQAQQGSGELLKPLQQLGISIKDSNGNFRESTDVFEEFLTKLGGTSNKAQQLALAMGAFDTEGVAFVNIAAMGAKEIANLRREAELAGLSIDQGLTDNAAKALDKLSLLTARAKGFAFNFFGAMGPAIGNLADDIKKAVDEAVAGAGGMEAFARDLSTRFLQGMADFLRNLGMALDGFTNSMAMATNVMKQLLVSLSPLIPGASFEFGSSEGVTRNRGIVEGQIGEVELGLEGQRRALEETNAALKALREEHGRFSREYLGSDLHKKASAFSMSISHNETRLRLLNNELEGLEDVYVFTKMATDSDFFTRAMETAATSVEKGITTINELGQTSSDVIGDKMTADAQATQQALSELAIAAQEYANNILTPNQTLLATFDDQRDKLGILIERYMHLDDQASSSGNNANLAMKQLAAEILATAGGLNNLSEAMRQAVSGVMIDQLVGDAKIRFNELTIEIAALEAELAEYDKAIYDAFRSTDTFKVVIEALEGALASAKGELRGLTGEMMTLGDLETAVATKTEQSAAAMAIYNEFLASGKRTAEEIAAAQSILGVRINTTTSEYKKYTDSLKDAAGAQKKELGFLKRMQDEYDQLKLKVGSFSEEEQKVYDLILERIKKIEEAGKGPVFDVIETLRDRLGDLAISTADTFTDVILGLKNGFEALEDIALQVLRTIISTLIEATIRKAILGQSLSFGGNAGGGMLGGILGGLGGLGASTLIPGLGLLVGLGGLLGGFFADGGSTARAGQKPIMVGERGPEIFLPGKAGTVVANEDLNSIGDQGDLNVSFTINAIDTQTGVEFLIQNKRVITGVIQEAYMRRGTSGPLG